MFCDSSGSMAAAAFSRHPFCYAKQVRHRNHVGFLLTHLSCQQGPEPDPQDMASCKKERVGQRPRRTWTPFIMEAHKKIGKEVKEGLRPERKGDWKDLVLMSLSFAVYFYTSQQIVCAYFAWISIPTPSW